MCAVRGWGLEEGGGGVLQWARHTVHPQRFSLNVCTFLYATTSHSMRGLYIYIYIYAKNVYTYKYHAVTRLLLQP